MTTAVSRCRGKTSGGKPCRKEPGHAGAHGASPPTVECPRCDLLLYRANTWHNCDNSKEIRRLRALIRATNKPLSRSRDVCQCHPEGGVRVELGEMAELHETGCPVAALLTEARRT